MLLCRSEENLHLIIKEIIGNKTEDKKLKSNMEVVYLLTS